MDSGMGVSPECVRTYQHLKPGKILRYIIYGLNSDDKEIVVLTKSTEQDYGTFLADLPEDECRWAVYDLEFDKGEGKRNGLTFVSWSPDTDTAKVRQKMVYASSKDTLRRGCSPVGFTSLWVAAAGVRRASPVGER